MKLSITALYLWGWAAGCVLGACLIVTHGSEAEHDAITERERAVEERERAVEARERQLYYEERWIEIQQAACPWIER